MSIETLTHPHRDTLHIGLAAVESDKLHNMRDAALRRCFTRMDEAPDRMEHVARIHGKEYINDAAARSINATWYSLQRIEGGVIWIAFGGDSQADYGRLRQLALRKVRMLICVGSADNILQEAFGSTIPIIRNVDSIADAVHFASRCDIDNVKVLFSPATRQGLSEETAGVIFRHEVNEL